MASESIRGRLAAPCRKTRDSSDALVRASDFGRYTYLGPRSHVAASMIGDYGYAMGDNQIAHAIIGKFANIATGVRINPPNHPSWRATHHHFTYRSRSYGFSLDDDDAIFRMARAGPRGDRSRRVDRPRCDRHARREYWHRCGHRLGRRRDQGRATFRHRRRRAGAGTALSRRRAHLGAPCSRSRGGTGTRNRSTRRSPTSAHSARTNSSKNTTGNVTQSTATPSP